VLGADQLAHFQFTTLAYLDGELLLGLRSK
jgi:hypothetical protein